MRPRRLFQILAVAAVLAHAGLANAEGWHSAQPLPPVPPEGQSPVGVRIPLGHIGQISFWAPNRGLLITSGTELVPAGLYYYNGVSWRELSTVCGGSEGRIAWAGENDFWTISNQQAGQQIGFGTNGELEAQDLSLCHFEDGRVVASYAEPIGVPDSYKHMYAVACSEPNDCWFGGERLSDGVNGGAFHLHWNGQTMTPVPSLETLEPTLEDPPHTVRSMAFYKGHFYESVQIEDAFPGESLSQPFLIHRIAEGSSNPFVSLIVEGPPGEPFTYVGEAALQLSADSSQLWAAADSTVLLNSGGQFQQVKLSDPSGALAGGISGVAAEPGTKDAWVTTEVESGSHALAHLARVQADGTVESADQLPEVGEDMGPKGTAQAIACPAEGDCWVATSQGWLFHLGSDYPEDDDPYFQNLISYRPPDASIPFEAPEDFPEDDSGANPPSIPSLPTSPSPPTTEAKVREALFSHVKAKLVGRATLALTFTLATKSHVKLVALRKKRKVAATRRIVLTHGRHTLTLRLDLRAWPTKLDLQVQAIEAVPLVSSSSRETETTGGPTVVTTSLHVFDQPSVPLPILP
jgi:hypothetical protein